MPYVYLSGSGLRCLFSAALICSCCAHKRLPKTVLFTGRSINSDPGTAEARSWLWKARRPCDFKVTGGTYFPGLDHQVGILTARMELETLTSLLNASPAQGTILLPRLVGHLCDAFLVHRRAGPYRAQLRNHNMQGHVAPQFCSLA